MVSIIIFLWTKKIFESYFRDRLTFSNTRSRTSRRIYRLDLPLRAPETLSWLSKSKFWIFNAHLTLFVRRMASHNSISKYHHFSKLTWNLPWNGASPFADQTASRMKNWKEVNVWSSTVYSCDVHEGRQHFITLFMFVFNFVLFFNLFTVDNISSHC